MNLVPQEDSEEEYKEELESPTLEVPSKYLMWRSHPSAIKRGFGEITKDIVLANLSEEDIKLIRMCFDLFGQNDALVEDKLTSKDDIDVANKFLERLVNTIAASSVGFKGFGRSLDTTMIQLKEIKKEDLTKKGKRINWRR